MKLVAVYGSLKRGQYNHAGLGADAEHMGDMTVRGVMYSNGAYPKLYKEDCTHEGTSEPCAFADTQARDHAVEVYGITEARYEAITRMEVGAGYEVGELDTAWGPATIYWMPHENFNSADKWVASY